MRVVGPPNDGYKAVFYAVKSGIFKKYGLDVQTFLQPVAGRMHHDGIVEFHGVRRHRQRVFEVDLDQEVGFDRASQQRLRVR